MILDEGKEFWEGIRLFKQYDNGVLMYDGGIADQPQIYLDLMSVIGGAVAETEAEMLKRAKSGHQS